MENYHTNSSNSFLFDNTFYSFPENVNPDNFCHDPFYSQSRPASALGNFNSNYSSINLPYQSSSQPAKPSFNVTSNASFQTSFQPKNDVSSQVLKIHKQKPNYSYNALIQMAINSTTDNMMHLKEIYNWIETNFPYFKANPKVGNWKNSIRHNLSMHDYFIKVDPQVYLNNNKKSKFKITRKTSIWSLKPNLFKNSNLLKNFVARGKYEKRKVDKTKKPQPKFVLYPVSIDSQSSNDSGIASQSMICRNKIQTNKKSKRKEAINLLTDDSFEANLLDTSASSRNTNSSCSSNNSPVKCDSLAVVPAKRRKILGDITSSLKNSTNIPKLTSTPKPIFQNLQFRSNLIDSLDHSILDKQILEMSSLNAEDVDSILN